MGFEFAPPVAVREAPRPAPVVAAPRPTPVRRVYAPLVVGRADSREEHAADATADRVVAALEATNAGAPSVRRAAIGTGHAHGTTGGRIRRVASVVGLDGGELDDATAALMPRDGRPLDPMIRRSMEDAFGGQDFGRVRIHTGAPATRFNDAIGATASTLGSDISFRDGMPDTDTRDGMHLLAHELAHTIQPGATVGRVVRRKIGFELEDDGKTAVIPKRQLTKPELKRHRKGQQVIALPSAFVDPSFGIRPPKATRVIRGTNFELQTDESEFNGIPAADLEFVTDPLDENQPATIQQVARDIATLCYRIDGFFHGHDNWILPQDGLKNGLYLKAPAYWSFKPQFTVEVTTGNVPGVMEDFGSPQGEQASDKNRRAPGRTMLSGIRQGGTGQKVMGTAPTLARWSVAQLDQRTGNGTFAAAAAKDVIGLVSIMVQYLKMASVSIPSYAKVIAPMMSRHSLAKLFEKLPDPQKQVLAANNATELLRVVLDAVNHLTGLHGNDNGYAANANVFRDFKPMVQDPGNAGQKVRMQLLNDVTIQQWCEGIPNGQDLLRAADYTARAQRAGAATYQQQQGAEQLESLGSFGMKPQKNDAAGHEAGAFEYRAASSYIQLKELEGYMLSVAAYFRDLAMNGNATLTPPPPQN